MNPTELKNSHHFGLMELVTNAVLFSIFALLVLWTSPAQAQLVEGGCGSLRVTGQFGPYDYRPDRYIPETTYRSHEALLRIVEHGHFTPEVEALVRGKTSATPGHDISYTLHAFPNHHRALLAMIALGEKENTLKPSGAPYSVECWIRRAIAWRQDDQIVRMIYASYLAKASRSGEAEQQLNVAATIAGDNAFTHHNIGLIYFDMKNYQKALIHAQVAYRLGLGIPTLREKLKSLGKWTDVEIAQPADKATNKTE